jgi:hypothetical protein
MARPEKVRLGEILVQQKLLSEDQLNQALADQKRTGRKLGRVFVESGFVTEEQISGALARQLGIPYINLKFYNINQDVVRLLPETQARRFRALVLEDRGETMLVGVSDPTDLFAYDEIARLVKKGVELAVVNETEVLAGDRPHLPPHRRDHRPGARARAGPRRHHLRRLRRAGRQLRPGRSAGRQAAAVGVRRRRPGARLRHPHRAAGRPPADPLPHRRRAAPADRGRHQDRAAAGAAPEADVGPRHLEKRLPQDGRFAVKVRTSASTCVSRRCPPSTANRSSCVC